MKQTKILHVIERFNIAGAEIVVRDIVCNNKDPRLHMEICVLRDKGVLGKELIQKGYIIHELNWSLEELSNIEVAFRLRRLIRRRNIDIIHAHNVVPWYFSVIAKSFLQIPLCVTIHGFITGKRAFIKKVMYNLFSLFTSKIVLVSNAILHQIRSLLFVKMSKVEIVPNGIDFVGLDLYVNRERKRKDLGLSNNDFVIGSVGRIYPEKNYEMQIQLVHLLIKQIPVIKLAIASELYPHMENLLRLADHLNVRNCVVFLGLRRDVPEILKVFDLFLMTSFSEGTSIALLEAMSAGLPVVASDVGGNKDVISHEKNGLLFHVHDVDQLSKYILDLYKNPAKSKQLATAAKRTSSRYSVENMILCYQKIYYGIRNN